VGQRGGSRHAPWNRLPSLRFLAVVASRERLASISLHVARMSDARVVLQLSFTIREERLDEFRQLASAVRDPAGWEGSCLCRAAFVSLDDRHTFLWVERWNDERQLREYLGSEEFRALVGGIRVLGSLVDQIVAPYAGPGRPAGDA
jgi:quinol monooxygenase YgiN